MNAPGHSPLCVHKFGPKSEHQDLPNSLVKMTQQESVATPAEPHGEKLSYLLEILGGAKLLEKCW